MNNHLSPSRVHVCRIAELFLQWFCNKWKDWVFPSHDLFYRPLPPPLEPPRLDWLEFMLLPLPQLLPLLPPLEGLFPGGPPNSSLWYPSWCSPSKELDLPDFDILCESPDFPRPKIKKGKLKLDHVIAIFLMENIKNVISIFYTLPAQNLCVCFYMRETETGRVSTNIFLKSYWYSPAIVLANKVI